MTTVVLTALHRGVTGSGSVLSSPRWTASCPAGGSARIELPEDLPFIGEVSLVNTTMVWTMCGYDRVLLGETVSGRTRLNGRWSSSAPSSPIQIQGALEYNAYGLILFEPWLVDVGVDGATGVYNGQILNLPVNGVVDGPFIPRPTPEPTPTPAPDPTPTPTPTPTPNPTPTPTPGGPGQFDGLYIGQIDSTSISAGFNAGLPIVIEIRAGTITNLSTFGLCAVTLGGTWTGGVDSNGIAQFDGTGTPGQTYRCSVSGLFVVSGSTVTASGTFSVAVSPSGGTIIIETGGGRWSVTRIPGS